MIKTQNLKKVYQTSEVETLALAGVDLEVEEEEFVSVMGPSGCGKSTLLNVLGLLDSPSGGTYHFAGQEISELSERQRATLRRGAVGFVFQNFNLIDELTVYENVELPLLYLSESVSERKEKVKRALDRTQIPHRESHYPQQLSGGQQQRVAVARSVVTNPKLILADEPTGNLYSTNSEQIMSLLEEMNDAGTAIVMVTHSPADAESADRVISLYDGQIVSIDVLEHEYTGGPNALRV